MLAVGLRRPALVVVVAALLASALGARSVAGLHPPPSGSFSGRVTLVSDPVDMPGGIGVEVRAGHRHLAMNASGAAASVVRSRLAGDRVVVHGRVRALGSGSGYLRARHVVGRLTVTRVDSASEGTWPWRMANDLHRAIADGGRWLPSAQQPLYGGFLIGDARGQPPEIAADMRAAGLGHLLVVSGENVAFLLTLTGPILRRIGIQWRWLAVVVLISGFAILTRFEPSVLRAVVMAGFGAIAMSLGRPAGTIRLLALAVTVLVLVDPLLLHQLGFGLSVGATAGICLLGPFVAEFIPGPRALARAVATTVAAQLGIAPLAAVAFGGLPVATLPANVLAAPAAAAVLVWGLPAGLVAHVVDGAPAAIVQFPTHLLVGWIAGVARWSAALPLGYVGSVGLAVALAAVAAALLAHRGGWHAVGRALVVVAIAPMLLAMWGIAHPPARTTLAGGVLWQRGTTVLVLAPGAKAGPLFDDLYRLGVRRIDVLVAPTGSSRPGATIALLRRRWTIRRVLAPPNHQIRDAAATRAGDRWITGPLTVAVTSDHPRLEVKVVPTATAATRGRVADQARDGPV